MSDSKRETMTRDEFLTIATGNGAVPIEKALFECPMCKTKQSATDLIDAGAGDSLESVQGYLAFSCIGRWDSAKGCDWTLGGLFQLHEVEVEFEPGQMRPCFRPVEPAAVEVES